MMGTSRSKGGEIGAVRGPEPKDRKQSLNPYRRDRRTCSTGSYIGIGYILRRVDMVCMYTVEWKDRIPRGPTKLCFHFNNAHCDLDNSICTYLQ